MDSPKLTAAELEEKLRTFAHGYYLVNVRQDKDSFLALSAEDLKKYPSLICGLFMNFAMDGELDKAEECALLLREGDFFRLALTLVDPKSSLKCFIKTLETLKKNNTPVKSIVLNAGRPYLLNGFKDFTPFAPFLKKHKELFIENLKWLYEDAACPAIYNVCLAEWYYQQDKVFDAGIILSRSINEFNRISERRLLFVALYLQTKILLASGKIVNAGSYIKNIRKFVKKQGEMEFSYNIDASEAMAAFYDGNHRVVSDWLSHSAPDEFADFNMLDLYRYMVKIRCYIVYEKYNAVVALAAKIRPLLLEGNRVMDLCELDLLLAICFYRSHEKELAFDSLECALKTVKHRKFYRLVADEGHAILQLLIDYVKERGATDFLMKIIGMSRDMAILYPLYLEAVYENDRRFTRMEVDVLRLLEQGKSREEIADLFFVSTNTVKFHLKNIYTKLGAKSAHHAVWKARILGII